MKKKSSALKMAVGTAQSTPSSTGRTPNSASSGGNTGWRLLPCSATTTAVPNASSAPKTVPYIRSLPTNGSDAPFEV